jgi:hypothetical protein
MENLNLNGLGEETLETLKTLQSHQLNNFHSPPDIIWALTSFNMRRTGHPARIWMTNYANFSSEDLTSERYLRSTDEKRLLGYYVAWRKKVHFHSY